MTNLAENDSKLSESVKNSTLSVFESMIGLKVESIGSEDAKEASQSSEVISLISFTGSHIGTLATFFSDTIALKIASAMLCMECETIDEDVQDIIGEIANMVAGNVKTEMADTYGDLQLSIPMVITGKGLAISSSAQNDKTNGEKTVSSVSFKNKETWHLVHFKLESETFTIGILVKKIVC